MTRPAPFCFGLNHQHAIFGNGSIGGTAATPTPVSGGLVLDQVALGGLGCGG
ncbi:MAG: hypothetical protein R2882_13240 [Gemmatimonadales bacterium]